MKKDEKEAVKWFQKAADKGDRFALHNLGVVYRDGLGVKKDEKAPLETWPIDPKCAVTINGQRVRNGALLKLTDLEPGVEVTILHDTHVKQIAAQITFRQKGVLEAVQAAKGTFDMKREGEDRPARFNVAKDCKFRLGDEAVTLAELHHGDEVSISFDSLSWVNASSKA